MPSSSFRPAEEVEDLLAGLGVQVAGGLVGQQQGRVVDQGPGDGHPLLLAAGELGRLVVQAVPQPHPVEQRLGAVADLLVRELHAVVRHAA